MAKSVSKILPQTVKEIEQLLEQPLEEINAYRKKNGQSIKALRALIDILFKEIQRMQKLNTTN